MRSDKLRLQRFELHYIIEEPVAMAIRDLIIPHLERDHYGSAWPNSSYPVQNLYLDSDDLRLYQATLNQERSRFKLRLRFYEDRHEAPIFFETKRRMDGVVQKERCGVKRDAVDWLLTGHRPELSHLAARERQQLVILQRFSALMKSLDAKPKAHVSYFREAWVQQDENLLRVTMDRQVQAEPETNTRLCPKMTRPVLLFGSKVVLKLKWTRRPPLWFEELVKTFEFRPCSASKYGHPLLKMETLSDTGLQEESLANEPDAALFA